MVNHIHVFGASGSGTSTLGADLARRLGLRQLDVDRLYWQLTDPPYLLPHDRSTRQRLLAESAASARRWVLAGSLCGWGDAIIPQLDLAVSVSTPTDLRLARLRDRESRAFGPRIAPGGDMHANHQAFLRWAAQYDDGPVTMRSRRLHEQWLTRLTCPVLRVDGSQSIAELVEHVAAAAS